MADDFSKEVRENWKQAEFADRENRDECLKDLQFAAGEHWDAQVREYRERMGIEKYGFPLPCLTINNMPAVVAQVTGDRRANEVSIKILPNEETDKATTDARSEIIRSIEVRSRAQSSVYLPAFSSMVNGGIHNFRVDLDYAYDDVFDRDIFINNIPNPLAVLWDPMAADPTGRDAGYCFVSDKISRAEFKRRFKESASELEMDAKGLESEGWAQEDTVRIAEYWTMFEKPRTIAMLKTQNGDTVVEDVTDRPEKEWKPRLIINPSTNKPMLREAPRKYARMVMTNGRTELSDALEVPLPRLPIIRVSGPEIWVGEKRVRFGLVRFARDPARLKDYWRSVIAEKLMLAPRANYMAPVSAVEGREGDWINTLVYNDNAPPPTPITGNDLAAMLNEAQMCAEDIKDVTGIFDASRGMVSNETSGVAISRRQHEGDIATIVYHELMNYAQQEAGVVVDAYIPTAYDTTRTLRLIGPDESVKFLRVNDPDDPNSIDLSKGRYDVTISTGPSYMTRRQESADSMIGFVQAVPAAGQVAGDLIAKAQDWPDADQIAERLKRIIPPQVLGDEADNDKSPEEIAQQRQQAEQAQALQQQAAELEMQAKQAATRKTLAEADRAEAEALKARAEAEKAEVEAQAARAEALIAGAHMAETAANDIPSGDMAA
jgi:hypothetical protein